MSASRHGLLFDFGASRIKTAILDFDSGAILHERSEASLPRKADPNSNRFVVSAKALRQKFMTLCDYYARDLGLTIDRILICSEMHGFLVTDKSNEPLTDYVSWKDQRALEIVDGKSAFSRLESDLGASFKSITGMRLRPSLPVANFLRLAETESLPKDCFLWSLPEWLLGSPIAHESMIAGLGVYDLNSCQLSSVIRDYVKERTSITIHLPEVSQGLRMAKFLEVAGQKIAAYTGVGDHPCAVLGAGNRPRETISVNIGTGSQVAIIDHFHSVSAAELRPFFNGKRLTTITHIPAGRVLNSYIGFLGEVASMANSNSSARPFWDLLSTLSFDEVTGASLEIGLSLFPGSWQYTNGGHIFGINERNLNVREYLASIIKALCAQYIRVIDELDPARRIGEIVLGGGIPQKLPIIKQLLKAASQRNIHEAEGNFEETLLGLKSLSEQI